MDFYDGSSINFSYKSKGGTPWKSEIKSCPRSTKLAVHQPMAKPILHTKFHQNRTMGLRSAPALYIVESKGSDPFAHVLWAWKNWFFILLIIWLGSLFDPSFLEKMIRKWPQPNNFCIKKICSIICFNHARLFKIHLLFSDFFVRTLT